MDRTVKFLGYAFLIITITFIIFSLFYHSYIRSNPLTNFLQIKSGIENIANLSDSERDMISKNIVTNAMVDKSLQSHLINGALNYVIAMIISSATVVIYYFKNPKGNSNGTVTTDVMGIPEKKIDFFKDSNNMIMTLDGILISIVGGFTVASGSKNLIIISGFEVLIVSIIYSYMAHISLTNGIQDEKEFINRKSFLDFSSRSNYSFWYFVMGLSLIIGGVVQNVL